MTPPTAESVGHRPAASAPLVERRRAYGWARRTVYGGGGRPGRAARVALNPLAWTWGALAERRLRGGRGTDGRRLPAPAISVGNVTLGGGGKTSLVEWIVREGVPAGVEVAVLSRGYGRESTLPHALAPGAAALPVSTAGDEPAVLARAGAWVGIAEDRFLGAGSVLELGGRPGLYVLDDGLQHRAVPRALDVVAFTSLDLEAPARCIPAGPLRQRPTWRPPRVVWVVAGLDPGERAWPAGSIGDAYGSWWGGEPGTAADWADAGAVGLEAWREGREDPFVPGDRRIVAVAGVARPESLADSARRAGFDLTAVVAWPDHHAYAEGDVAGLRAAYPDAAFVTTEKDAVKLSPAWFAGAPAGVLRRRLVPRDGELLRREIAEAMGR